MNGRERLRLSMVPAPAQPVVDKSALREAHDEGFGSGFMTGIGVLLALEIFIALLAVTLWWCST